MGEAQTWNNGARKAYLESMFQLGTRDWHKACAMEWIARVSASSGKAPKDVSLKDIQDMIISSDPHTAIESHLPGFVPLDYVDHVYVKRGVIDSNGIKAIKEANVKYTEVINPKEEVIRIMRTRTLADKDLAGMQGYTFAMPREKEIVLPVNLESIENAGRIRFTAHIKEGDNFVFELKNDKDVLSVVFTKNAVGYAEIDLINTKSAKKADPCKTMCPVPIPGLGIFFSIAIDKAGKKCVVEHTSLSGVDKFEVPLKFKPILFSVYDSDSVNKTTN